jgi:hypothetical protein
MNKYSIMTRAWQNARYAASVFGGQASQYLSSCLRIVWASYKTSGSEKQKRYAADLKAKAVIEAVETIAAFEKIRTNDNSHKVDRVITKIVKTISIIEKMSGYAGDIIGNIINGKTSFGKKESNFDNFG